MWKLVLLIVFCSVTVGRAEDPLREPRDPNRPAIQKEPLTLEESRPLISTGPGTALEESPSEFKKRVLREVEEMDGRIDMEKGNAGALSTEQKGALATFKERRMIVTDRVSSIDSLSPAELPASTEGVESALRELRSSYDRVLDLFSD